MKGIWETTQQGNIQTWDRIYNLVSQVFPGVPVYPIIGNHEGYFDIFRIKTF
jgi:hypothetical protein